MQLAHGADPFLKNQEGQSGVELATADDVKCLLQDAMASQQNVTISPASTTISRSPLAQAPQNQSETVIMPSGAAIALSVPVCNIYVETLFKI